MPHASGIVDLLRDLSRFLPLVSEGWYLFGAQAVIIWGSPRMTADVDVTVKLREENPMFLVNGLAEGGFRVRVARVEEFVQRTRVIPFVHEPSGIPVDVVIAGPGPEEEFLRRAANVEIGGILVPVISPEDLVITKILAGRPKDLEDARSVIRSRGAAMDISRVRLVLRLLEEALGQSDLTPSFEDVWSREAVPRSAGKQKTPRRKRLP